jgi:hypothetical protein
VTAFLAIWLHYTAVSIVRPLLVWVGTRSTLRPRPRAVLIAVCLAALRTVLPVPLEQYHYNQDGRAIAGAINWNNILGVKSTPFGARSVHRWICGRSPAHWW